MLKACLRHTMNRELTNNIFATEENERAIININEEERKKRKKDPKNFNKQITLKVTEDFIETCQDISEMLGVVSHSDVIRLALNFFHNDLRKKFK